MYQEKAKNILNKSTLHEEDKDLWINILSTNGEDAAKQFVEEVGDDENALKVATGFMKVRFGSGEELKEGEMTKAEENLMFEVFKNDERLVKELKEVAEK